MECLFFPRTPGITLSYWRFLKFLICYHFYLNIWTPKLITIIFLKIEQWILNLTRKGFVLFFWKKKKKKKKKTQNKTNVPLIPPELSFLYATRHLVLFYISSIIKIFRKVFVLQSRDKKSNSNTRRGDNSKSCHSCMWHVVWSCSSLLPSIIKIFQRVFDLHRGH